MGQCQLWAHSTPARAEHEAGLVFPALTQNLSNWSEARTRTRTQAPHTQGLCLTSRSLPLPKLQLDPRISPSASRNQPLPYKATAPHLPFQHSSAPYPVPLFDSKGKSIRQVKRTHQAQAGLMLTASRERGEGEGWDFVPHSL